MVITDKTKRKYEQLVNESEDNFDDVYLMTLGRLVNQVAQEFYCLRKLLIKKKIISEGGLDQELKKIEKEKKEHIDYMRNLRDGS